MKGLTLIILFLFCYQVRAENIELYVRALASNSKGKETYFQNGVVAISLNSDGRGEWKKTYNSGDREHFISIVVSHSQSEYEIFGYLSLEGGPIPQTSSFFLNVSQINQFISVSSIGLEEESSGETWLSIHPTSLNFPDLKVQQLHSRDKNIYLR